MSNAQASDAQGGRAPSRKAAPASEIKARKPPDVVRFVLRPQSAEGNVYCALFDRDGWDTREPLDYDIVKARDGRVTCEFKEIAPGEYALAAFHDKNGDETLELTTLGLPDEPWAISGKSSLLFGLPSFDSAKFHYDGGVLTLKKPLD